jgi:hypothetical protein
MTENEKLLLDDLIYFIRRVQAGSIRSYTTLNRYVSTVEKVTGKSIDEVLKEWQL